MKEIAVSKRMAKIDTVFHTEQPPIARTETRNGGTRPKFVYKSSGPSSPDRAMLEDPIVGNAL